MAKSVLFHMKLPFYDGLNDFYVHIFEKLREN